MEPFSHIDSIRLIVAKPDVKGFLSRPKLTAGGNIYHGRLTCPDVQWTGEGRETFVTFTITAGQLSDAAENGILWTDQDVQRGIVPGLTVTPPRELSLANGYPDSKFYIFDVANADNMAEKLLEGERVFLNPLVWNLRPTEFSAYWNKKTSEIYIYTGKIFLPDSHHRHQAIIKAVKIWRESPSSYRRFSEERQFKIELYFLTKEDEGNYFFDKNQRPKPVAKSKAYDLTTLDDLSLLAKKVIEKSSALNNNVNRVTDRLTAKNPQVITLSTLREMMKSFAPAEALDNAEMEGLARIAATFYDLLATARPELAQLAIPERRAARENLLVDAAVMMHGYAALMREFNDSIPRTGIREATNLWKNKLQRISATQEYSFGRWSGDLF